MWECPVDTELLLYPFVGRELAQALGDLPAVFDCKEPHVTVPLAEHEVVCLPYLFGGGSEEGEGVGEAGSSKFPDDAIEMAQVVVEGGHLCRVDIVYVVPRQHFD